MSGNHLSEATNGPTYKTAILNGLAVARFDGTNDILKNTAMAADTSFTVFMVVQKRSAPAAPNNDVFSMGGNVQLYTSTAVHATQYVYYLGSGSTVGGTATNITAIVLRINSAASMNFFMNGGTPVTMDPDDLVTTSTTYAYGARDNATSFGDYDIGEILVYNSALVASDMNLIGNYLERWGLTWTDV